MKKKEYRCPECGGKIPFAAIDFGRDSMRCPGCGAVSSCRLYVQRERARGELGAPPRGVRVCSAAPAVDGQSASEVVYCWRRLYVILILTGMAGLVGFGAVVTAASAEWIAALICVALLLASVFFLFCEVFGRSRLAVGWQKAAFSTECWFYRRRVEFFLPPDSLISVKTRMKYAGAKEGDAVSEIVVERPKMPDAAFGQSLPEEAQDYFCECLARGALGIDLPNAKGRAFAGQVAHPFPFVLFLVAALASFAFAFSKTETIEAGDGKLVIVEKEWWGGKEARTEFSDRDVRYVDLVMGRKNHNSLEFQGNDGRVIRTLTGYESDVGAYQIGIMNALKCDPSIPFARSRFPWIGLIALGFALLVPAALSCRLRS